MKSQTDRFLNTLFGRYFQDHDGFLEVRFVGQGSARPPKFFPKGQISESDWALITELNTNYHVFFGVNPRRDMRGRQEDIKDVICLWADIDGKDFEGGKSEALNKVQDFALRPSIIVDSGRGYHCYWLLNEPIIGIDDERRLEIRQTLAGLIGNLDGDRSRMDLSSCLRLPGTLNIKGNEPLVCKIIEENPDRYEWGQFARFRDTTYQEPISSDEPLPQFGTRTKVVSRKDAESTLADIAKLEIDSRAKNLIITGSLIRRKGGDATRSGRDMSIICNLIYNDYDYQTIQSIFFNPFLKCSNRIMEEGEAALKWDVGRALEFVQQRKREGTPTIRKIAALKDLPISTEEKRKEIQSFIISDLLTGPTAVGEGFADRVAGSYYFFDKAEKMLMNLESTDFYCFIRSRYNVPKKDFEEIKDAVMTQIWVSKKDVTPHRFAYYDSERFILYVSDHDNGVYRLDGEKIERHDNGIDGVFFEYDPTLTPFTFDPAQKVAEYFITTHPARGVAGLVFPETTSLGLSFERFYQDDSLLNEFIVKRVFFDTDQETKLLAEEQRLLLIVFFYSMYFESIQREKPIACFIGQKESGKSFTATSIGKLFFGAGFESAHEPSSAEDLKTLLGRHSYLVLDNVDKHMSDETANVLCVAATGGVVEKRKLYKDTEVVRFTPRCFIAMTSREPKFKRDDLVSRLLLFNTQRIETPKSRSVLFSGLLERRDAIMTEVLRNLNLVVLMLAYDSTCRQQDHREAPRCISRIADWETFGRTICKGPAGFMFRMVMQMMNDKKDRFAIEDDYLYLILYHLVYEKNQPIIKLVSNELYSTLVITAEGMRLKDFERKYKSAVSMAKHLAAIKRELEQEFEIEFYRAASGQTEYTFKRLHEWGDEVGEDRIEDREE